MEIFLGQTWSIELTISHGLHLSQLEVHVQNDCLQEEINIVIVHSLFSSWCVKEL